MLVETNVTKVCNVCNQEKEIGEFYFRKDGGKHNNHCKKCKPLRTKASIISECANRTSKVCKQCGVHKPLSEYNKAGGGRWLQSYCKPCDSERKKEYARQNSDKVNQSRKAYFDANRGELNRKNCLRQKEQKKQVNEYRRSRYQKKKDDILAYAKKLREKRKVIVSEEEKVAIKEAALIRRREKRRAWCSMKSATDIQFRILKNLRSRVRWALKRNNNSKLDTTENLLGCTIAEFKVYIEGLFTEGMSWENMGEWHLDHKNPCKNFDLSKEEQQRDCFAFKNQQPLWRIDNLQKGIKKHEEWLKL